MGSFWLQHPCQQQAILSSSLSIATMQDSYKGLVRCMMHYCAFRWIALLVVAAAATLCKLATVSTSSVGAPKSSNKSSCTKSVKDVVDVKICMLKDFM